jgi:predicted metal-dependent hydrolase
MVIKIGLENINIFFQRKSIKKTYLRVTNKREILITSPLNLKEEDLKQLINENYEWLKAKLEKVKIIDIGKDEFMLFGKKYQVKYNKVKQIEINNDIIVTDKIIRN